MFQRITTPAPALTARLAPHSRRNPLALTLPVAEELNRPLRELRDQLLNDLIEELSK